ncbi:hypothetical protein [Geobacter sp. FeAm09]|uniref:hypothetical protein n=1 Tax=Geobacter sp. FeAm09 TaxID=2597769 RepID=UPI00143D9FBE|nr:hypothetical protein [Geobacter sp. FeAm09]
MGIRGMKRAGALLVAGIVVSAPAWASVGPSSGERRDPPGRRSTPARGRVKGTP